MNIINLQKFFLIMEKFQKYCYWVKILVGKRFAEDIFGFYQGIPLVCDGYAVYNIFETIQRCWAHVLRHGKAAICDNETRRLYKKLQKLFAHAKKIQAKDQSQVTPKLRLQVQKMIQKTLDIAQEYHKLDSKFGTHLENAAKDLYTFVTHPGMETHKQRI